MILRDPVHGDVEFTESERSILDTREIQRLRGIKQLGTSYLVYPGALHTRFDHVVGTMAVAKRILEGLRSKGNEISEGDEEIVSASALVHDVSHVPFGHTFEDERRILPGHEQDERLGLFLSEGELADQLREMGVSREVRSILHAKEPLEMELPKPWLAQVVKDSVSADLLDYLRRDSYFTGIEQNYDERVFRYFILADCKVKRTEKRVLAVDLGKEGMIRQDARSEVLHLLRMRYFLTERVYYHHAKQSSGAMVSKALEMALASGFDPADLAWMSDWQLLRALESRGGRIARLILGVTERKLLKRAFVLGSEIDPSKRAELISLNNRPEVGREEAESEILRRLAKQGLEAEEGEVVIHCPDLGTMKEARVFARDEEGVIERLHRHRRPVSRDLDHLERQYLAIWKFFVFAAPRLVRPVNGICRKIYGAEGSMFMPKAYG